MLPDLVIINGGPLSVLPQGLHTATLAEVEAKFAFNPRRKRLMKGLEMVSEYLFDRGCKAIYLDGSFVTDKEFPNDFDGVWDISDIDLTTVDQILWSQDKKSRQKQKTRFQGELFPSEYPIWNSSIIKFFQIDRQGNPKGIIKINNPKLVQQP